MIDLIKSYIKFLLNSTNEHGVHSPFVFDLITKCFHDKTIYPEYNVLKNYRKSLLENKNTIEVTDFGAGSRIFKSNNREIAKIAQTAGISSKNAELLFRITHYFQPKNILEIGTSLGLATSALSSGNQNAEVISLEGCPQTLNQGQLQLQKFNFNNVQCLNTEFSTYFDNLKLETSNLKPQIFDLIFFDGNHSKKATLAYFEALLSTISNDSVWIFDDIHWSLDMEEAWDSIKNHPEVSVTIDTFQWGIVFFRKEQNKQHFIINPNRTWSSYLFEKFRI